LNGSGNPRPGDAAALPEDERQRRFRIMAEAAFEGIALTDRGRIVDVNDQLARMVGRERQELAGRQVADFVAPEHRDLVGRAQEAGRVEPYEHLMLRPDGTKVPVEIRGRAVSVGGRELRVTAIRDVTERRRAEEALRHSERTLAESLRRARMGYWEFDIASGLFTFNDQYYRLHGATAEQMGGYQMTAEAFASNHVHPDHSHMVAESIRRAVETRDPGFEFDVEARLRCVDGADRWVKVWFRIEKDAQGRTTKLHGVIQDITQRRLAEAALRQANVVVESSPAVLFRWRAASGWPVEYVTENVRQFGYTPQELLSGDTPYATLVHPHDLARVAQEVEAHSASGVQHFEQSYRILTRGGDVRWVDDRTAVERDAQGRITHYQGVLLDVTERKVAEAALQESESRFRQVVEAAPLPISVSDTEGRIVYVNARFSELLGYTMADAHDLAEWFQRAYPNPDYRREVIARWERTLREARRENRLPRPMEVEITCKDGTVRPVQVFGAFIEGRQVAIFNDLSEHRRAARENERLQAELLQAQKMESVGRLAGGVAHDFNNMLAAILGQVEVTMMDCSPSEPIYEDLRTIQKAALRSAELVRQLLAFARKQTVAPKVLDLNETVAGVLRMLKRLIGEDIEITFSPGTSLWPVRIDPAQVDQILANLCVNARDAIEGVGKIILETADAVFDDAYCALHPGSVPGEYVMLAVSDDGCGMSKEVVDHVFEPFFTTKGVGRGTGLGLASVYGIVKQNGGLINAYSELGKGTTIRIYLPHFVGLGSRAEPAAVDEIPRGNGETVLLVEDEAMILGVTKSLLQQLGYRVLAASAPSEALVIAGSHREEIALLITDVIMPEMSGADLARALGELKPGLRSLFMSGYSANVIADRGVLDEQVHLLQKPFTVKSLAVEVRKALHGA
jgi:PAS domain S-box-containing protein